MIVLAPGTIHTMFNSIAVGSTNTESLNRALVKVVYFVCTEIENIES